MKVHWSGLMEAREEEIVLIYEDREGARGKIGKIGQKSEMGWAQMGYR